VPSERFASEAEGEPHDPPSVSPLHFVLGEPPPPQAGED